MAKARHCYLEALDIAQRITAKQDEMFFVNAKLELAQTEDISNKDVAFKLLDEALAKAEGIAKMPVLEKKRLRMQVNNTKKNILYRR